MATDHGPLAGTWRCSPRLLLVVTAVVVASQAIPWTAPWRALPPLLVASRSPSSDMLMGAVPLPNAADTLDVLHETLPLAPGVVVAHAPADLMASAYMVIAMRLWPRPVTYIACAPSPRVEQFLVPHPVPTPAWRIDLTPGGATPFMVSTTATADADAACAPRP